MRRPAGEWLLVAGWGLLVVAVFWALTVAWSEGVLQKGMDPDYQAPVVASRPRPAP